MKKIIINKGKNTFFTSAGYLKPGESIDLPEEEVNLLLKSNPQALFSDLSSFAVNKMHEITLKDIKIEELEKTITQLEADLKIYRDKDITGQEMQALKEQLNQMNIKYDENSSLKELKKIHKEALVKNQ